MELTLQQQALQEIRRPNDAVSRFPPNDAVSRFPPNVDVLLRPRQSLLQPPPHRICNLPSPNPSLNSSNAATNNNSQQLFKASLQLAYQDAWRVCHPDFNRPFSSLEDACDRLLPYHVVADFEADKDDKILDADMMDEILSHTQQWDRNVGAKAAEFTATFEKQVLAFNMISHQRGLGEFRTEEKLIMEKFLLQEERRALVELKSGTNPTQNISQEANTQAAALVYMEQAHTEMMA